MTVKLCYNECDIYGLLQAFLQAQIWIPQAQVVISMVFCKVRETYDLKTVANKMTVIGIRTPKPQILKDNFPGLLMQCKAFRPVSCDVRVACASTMSMDPLGVGTAEGDVAPEDLFNPILYKPITNVGMSQVEARILAMTNSGSYIGTGDVNGNSAVVDVDNLTNLSDEFGVYYGLLANSHGWMHANPQSGFEMTDIKPLVFEMLYSNGDNGTVNAGGVTARDEQYAYPNADGTVGHGFAYSFRGNAKPMPFVNCTAYSVQNLSTGAGVSEVGFKGPGVLNAEIQVPDINVVCGCIIIPPSRLHELFFRMVVEWTIEFSGIRPIGEITNFIGLGDIGSRTHYQNYSYSAQKLALTGDADTILDKDSSMVTSNVDIKKVM